MTDTVSLYAGLMTQADIDGVTYIYSPLNGLPAGIDVSDAAKKWDDLCALTGEVRELSLDGKIIIYQPLTTGASSAENESAVILGDQVLLCNYQPSPEGICLAYFESGLPIQPNTGLLRDLFLNSLFSESNADKVEKPPHEALQMLCKYDFAGEISDTDEWEEYLYESHVTFYQLMKYQLGHLGKDYVMKEIYKYLTNEDENSSINQVDFLYYLGGDNDA